MKHMENGEEMPARPDACWPPLAPCPPRKKTGKQKKQKATGPPRQATGPPWSGAGLGVGMLRGAGDSLT